MKFSEFLGLKVRDEQSAHSEEAHLRAMKRVSGDPTHMQALNVLATAYENSAESWAHRQGVQDGSVIELHKPVDTETRSEQVRPRELDFKNVRVIQAEVHPVELFDQDKEIS